MPTGKHPNHITPVMAENETFYKKKKCSNLDILSNGKQRTLMKKIVSAGLWPQVELNSADNMDTMVRKVGEAYERQVPIFARKVKFLELTRLKGEGYKEWMNKIDHQSELAHLEGIKASE